MVNHILSTILLEGCALEAADMNTDGIINIQDLISLVNAILGSARSAQLNGSAQVNYLTSGNDLIIHINSDVDLAGIELSIPTEDALEIQLKDNSHISQESSFKDGINRYLAYSLFNQQFDGRTSEILVKGGAKLNVKNTDITVADRKGDAIYLSKSVSGNIYQDGPHRFELAELYPNPFNPSTEIQFTLPVEEYVRLSAYDIRGQEVDVIFEGIQAGGQHYYTWNAGNLPSGVYYIRLQAGNLAGSQKALLIK